MGVTQKIVMPGARLQGWAWVLACLCLGRAVAGELQAVALDHFGFAPASFYTDADGRPAAWAGKGGQALWIVALGGVVEAEGEHGVTRVSATGPEAVLAGEPVCYVNATAIKGSENAAADLLVRIPPDGVVLRAEPVIVCVLAAVAPAARADTYPVGLEIEQGGQRRRVELILRVIPLDVPAGEPATPAPEQLTTQGLVEGRIVEFNRYAEMLRVRADTGATSSLSIFYSLSGLASKEAAARRLEPAEAPCPHWNLDAIRQAFADGLPTGYAASNLDLRMWRSAWLNLRLARAAAGFYVGTPDVALMERVKLDAEWLPTETPKRPPRLVCPLAAGPIELDGQLREKAWTTAAVVDRFEPQTREAGAEPPVTQIRLCHDETNLYIGILAGGLPPGYFAAAREPLQGEGDADLSDRDVVILSLYPFVGSDSNLVVLVDPHGTCRTIATAGPAAGLGQAAARAAVSPTHWTAEVRIPLGGKSAETGDWWRFSAGRSGPAYAGGMLAWPSADDGTTADGPADLVLARPTCTLTRFDLGRLAIGENRMRFTLHNGTDAALSLQATLIIKGREGPGLRTQVVLPRLPAGQYIREEMTFNLGESGVVDLGFQIRDAESGRVLCGANRYGVRAPRAVVFSGVHYLCGGKSGTVELDLGVADAMRSRYSLRVTLRPAGGREPIGELHLPSLRSLRASIRVPTSDLSIGTYLLRGELTTAEGEAGSGGFIVAVFPHFLAADADGR